MVGRPHIIAVPYPAQGHVGPMMKLCHHIADHGFRVTFLVPDLIHAKVQAAMPPKKDEKKNWVELTSIPEGIQPEDDRTDRKTVGKRMLEDMPGQVEDLIRQMNLSDDEKISCVISDVGWALESSKKLGIKRAFFWPSTVSAFVLSYHIPKLVEARVVDDSGVPINNEMIQLTPNMPAICPAELLWYCPGDPIRQNHIFKLAHATSRNVSISNWVLCNSFYELDPAACDSIPNLLSIGPLNLSSDIEQPAGSFLPEDSTCISWLTERPARSVIYVAFGSTTMFSQNQIEELAGGLELIGRPFLWVVRPGLIKATSEENQDGLLERLASQGKIVEWAPQDKVLAHPSIACFLTHCGWNSTLEGLSMGVPLLCWPYFADQFLVRRYICDVWKVGFGLDADERGIISRHEIKKRTEELLSHGSIRKNSLKLREMAANSVSEGGSSWNNFNAFVEQLKC